ncbi:zeta toxin family protein [Streptomyces sp.]|uniref:zeta toxin family protein n=1 Tax=Streptomyces sp. TaxID=1931 RepID=UPI002D786B3C|nr:zeta toxin family protein [Streptomyces sp.]HET6354333.1 zeta toxin family protein [Streptomyces sp.]
MRNPRVHHERVPAELRTLVRGDTERTFALGAQERPVAVYVMGPPGAGKTRAARLLQHALRGRMPTRLVGDDFKVSHLDYLRLLQESPPRGERPAASATARRRTS